MNDTRTLEGDKDAPEKTIHARAIADIDEARDFYKKDYEQGLEDNDFLQGDQWPENVRTQREKEGKPCLQIPRLHPFVHQVENEIRQSRPAIKVSPVDDKADVETARIIKGIIRNVETTSGADNVYDTGAHNSITKGYGWIRINTRWSGEKSFDQEIEILEVFDPTSVMLDPSHRKKDGSDANWGVVYEEMSRSAFKAEYPDADPVSFETFGSTHKDWCDKDTVRIAEYYYKEFTDAEIVEAPDGTVMLVEEATAAGMDINGLRTRKTKISSIKWCKLTAAEILEETDWAGSYIPLVPIYGDLIFFNGKRRARSLIYHAKDSQRLLNFWKSYQAETIALQTRAPWVGAKGSFASTKNQWLTSSSLNPVFLEYDLVVEPETGQIAPAPTRQPPIMGSPAAFQESQGAADDIKAALGMFAPSLGEQGDEKSGKAILARQQQGNNATFHFMDNLATAIRHVGRILVDLIPKIVTKAAMMRILGEDGKEEVVQVNKPFTDKNGREVLYDLQAGKYDVVVSVGPGYQTKRIESVNTLIQLIQANPAIAPIVGDVLFKNLDFAESEVIEKRLRSQLPPELQGDDPGAMQLQKADQVIKALTQQVEQMQAALEDKSAEEAIKRETEVKKLQLESRKVDIEDKKATAEIQRGQIDAMGQQIANANAIDPAVIQDIIAALQELGFVVNDTAAAVDTILGADEPPPGAAMEQQGTPVPA